MDNFRLDLQDLERLEEVISKLGDKAEKETNKILHDFGFNVVKEDVTNKLPVSERNKKHAKFSDPFKPDTYNLGFDFKTKGGAAKNKNSWGYLVFPNEGRGIRNPREQDFAGEGIDIAKPKILKELLEQITSKIEEAL